jgi:hypothetical protein
MKRAHCGMRVSLRDDVVVRASDDWADSQWIERGDLLALVQRDVHISGDESAESALMREPELLIPVGAASVNPLDLPTYSARLERWEAGEGPRLTGMREFVHTLEALDSPARAAAVEGATTRYAFLLDAEMSRVLACVAIDPPAPG